GDVPRPGAHRAEAARPRADGEHQRRAADRAHQRGPRDGVRHRGPRRRRRRQPRRGGARRRAAGPHRGVAAPGSGGPMATTRVRVGNGCGFWGDSLQAPVPLAAIRPRVVSANVYFGARPIVEALQRGASIVITGRVADASLTLAPAVHAFGWRWDDWDRLAAATTAGHLIECGAQVTGGLWCNWREIADLAGVGYPVAEMDADGAFTITKPPGTGGAVNRE